MNEIFEIIQEARKRGASDIHISQGLPMLFRINGSLGRPGEQWMRRRPDR